MESIREYPPPSLANNNVGNSGHFPCKLGHRNCSSSLLLLSGGFVQKRNSGRKKFHETHHPTYRGVRQRNGKWVCEMREPHFKSRRLGLGTFTCPDMAARAYDVAAVALKGDPAVLNFFSTVTGDTAASSESSHDSTSPSYKTTTSEVAAAEAKSETLEKVCLDEEEIFNMPSLISSFAEGLMLPPPAMHYGFDCLDDNDLLGIAEDFRLWSD